MIYCTEIFHLNINIYKRKISLVLIFVFVIHLLCRFSFSIEFILQIVYDICQIRKTDSNQFFNVVISLLKLYVIIIIAWLVGYLLLFVLFQFHSINYSLSLCFEDYLLKNYESFICQIIGPLKNRALIF